MQDNFNIHEWRLNRALTELNEKKLCTECGSGYMEEGQCMECGYMEEGFPDLSGDGKVTQKDILIGKGVIKKEATMNVDFVDDDYSESMALKIVNALRKMGADRDKIILIAKAMVRMPSLNEGEDHEVSMAQASLKSIMSSASKLMTMLGNEERDIPGWIQDHITNAENYIDQAAQGFHELDNETEYEEN